MHTEREKDMIQIINYCIEADTRGYVIYDTRKMKFDKRYGKKIPQYPLYSGSLTDDYKIVMRESMHDFIEETKGQKITSQQVLDEIHRIEAEITKGMKDA